MTTCVRSSMSFMSKSFYFGLLLIETRSRNLNGRVASPESVFIHPKSNLLKTMRKLHCKKWCSTSAEKYRQLSLSRLRLSQITPYLEEKIWSLFKHRNLTSGNKILWIRGEIAPQEQFLPFPTIFSIYISN